MISLKESGMQQNVGMSGHNYRWDIIFLALPIMMILTKTKLSFGFNWPHCKEIAKLRHY